ncbi:unnamed protein product [Vitrella brassicaformis CCMP3155]|uniref:Uncharacterized protein n=1 Tax=Vitrella brassicaformis (strain CCMP3155) TaxID=1169540 RepID=A0A0G4EIN2_VITBC|nr:unnamed protein product [Vitrella brassicaformis CCMP3155]|mmetsp:Transcript_43728/g.109127  ORF Transcript_43728/g.109127 Transcript_43728/m.109127 type:complete len:270 (+) Transcript_43728:93-902(+)|eukprot:CEL96863.1 unnamed protein product [Vitrella brassicaformis CCMP3155]
MQRSAEGVNLKPEESPDVVNLDTSAFVALCSEMTHSQARATACLSPRQQDLRASQVGDEQSDPGKCRRILARHLSECRSAREDAAAPRRLCSVRFVVTDVVLRELKAILPLAGVNELCRASHILSAAEPCKTANVAPNDEDGGGASPCPQSTGHVGEKSAFLYGTVEQLRAALERRAAERSMRWCCPLDLQLTQKVRLRHLRVFAPSFASDHSWPTLTSDVSFLRACADQLPLVRCEGDESCGDVWVDGREGERRIVALTHPPRSLVGL